MFLLLLLPLRWLFQLSLVLPNASFPPFYFKSVSFSFMYIFANNIRGGGGGNPIWWFLMSLIHLYYFNYHYIGSFSSPYSYFIFTVYNISFLLLLCFQLDKAFFCCLNIICMFYFVLWWLALSSELIFGILIFISIGI